MDFANKIQNIINKNNFMNVCYYKIDNDNNLVLFYDDNFNNNNNTYKYKNIIYDLKEEKPICSQFNQPIINIDNIKKFIDNNSINVNFTISKSTEGTHITVFYHNNKWFITTKKCLDISNSKWNGNTSYYDMFMTTIKDKFNLDDLNKNYCYHFNLININNNRITEIKNSKIELFFINEKYTLKPIEFDDDIKKIFKDILIKKEIFNNNIIDVIDKYQNIINNMDDYNYLYKEIENKYDDINERNKKLKEFENEQNNIFLTSDGYNLTIYFNNDNSFNDNINKLSFNSFDGKLGFPIICKIQHPIYMFLSNHPVLRYHLNYPKYDIIYYKFILDTCEKKNIKPILKKQVFVKNYNKTTGKFDLQDYDLSKYKDEINNLIKYLDANRVKNAIIKMQHNLTNLSILIKDIYFTFLNNNSLYAELPDIYKIIKFLIHGEYLKNKENNKNTNGVSQTMIYNYLLTYEPDNIKEMLLNYNDAVNVLYDAYSTNTYRDINLPSKIYNKTF